MLAKLPLRIAITGGAGYLGTSIAKALLSKPEVEQIIALDIQKPKWCNYARAQYIYCDVRKPFITIIRDTRCSVLIHLAYPLEHKRSYSEVRPFSIEATQNVIRAAKENHLRKLILCSTTTVYGAYPGPRRLFTERDPSRPNRGYHYAVGKRDMEEVINKSSDRLTECEVVIFRPCIVMGPNMDNYMIQGFFGSKFHIRGHDPTVQFLHEEDFGSAMLHLIEPGVRGTYNITPNDVGVRRSDILRLFGVENVEVASWELKARMRIKWLFSRDNRNVVAPETFHLIAYEWLASNDLICRTTGFRPQYSSLDTLLDMFRSYRRKRRYQKKETKWKALPI